MEKKHDNDECLENLWKMKEENQSSMATLKSMMGDDYKPDVVKDLLSKELVALGAEETTITLTPRGEELAKQLIRSHRLAERMVHDVLGGEFEAGACEFEHIANPGLVNSICTLLGHPRECPHGLPIPMGRCCEEARKVAESTVIPVTELKVGQTARVAYINCRNDNRLHKLDNLQVKPSAVIKLHQIYPTIVIECENADIAIDESVARDICVWKPQTGT
ncbi:MAG: metal-dependent transcriptional regulator [Deltaproteobacteria bacterium]|nr:metal-dependent transcriptional regulator [Deltaproteobacteria bacterium]